MLNESQKSEILDAVLDQLLQEHLLPWRLDI